MYVPAYSRVEDVEQLHAFMREYSFATVISGGEGLTATHLPLVLDSAGDRGMLHGHMARANGHWQVMRDHPEVLVVFQGPHAYVSPSWYAGAPNVPTWNYTAVHAYGHVTLVEDEAELRKSLQQLVAANEAHRENPWQLDVPESYLAGLLRGIVGFRIRITRLEGKAKLSQNKPREDQERVIAALAASGRSEEVEVANWMRRNLAGDRARMG